ncbi:MAG TPA: hypothetical protein VH540_16345 [Ktedonobacterales bacterium]
MSDSHNDPGTYPKRPARPAGNSSLPPGNALNRRPRISEPPGQQRAGARMVNRPDLPQTPRPRFAPDSKGPGQGRPQLPYAQESGDAYQERTERLRAMRQDFLTHSDKKITAQKPRNIWLAAILTICLLVACVAGGIVLFQYRNTLFTSGGQDIATHFLDTMKKDDYRGAYADCAANVQEVVQGQNIPISRDDFVNKATQADQDDGSGPISAYEMTGSSTIDSNNEQYSFTLTRNGKQIPNVTITVTNGSNGWKVSAIDSSLFSPPAQPVPTPGPAEDTPTP